MQHPTVIIGAGLAGMIAALVLVKHNRKVVIVEQASLSGLVLRGFKKQGVRFETGLHYTGGLGDNGPLTRYFRYLGLENIAPVAFDQTCFDEIRFTQSQRKFSLPVGYEAQYAALLSAFPKEDHAIFRYLEITRRIYSSSTLLSFKNAAIASQHDPAWQQPLSHFLNSLTNDEELKTILALHCLLYGVSPEHISLLQHARIAGSYHDSVHTFAEGGLTLVRSLVAELEKMGVTIMCKAKVVSCTTTDQKQLSGVILENGTHIPAQQVVYTGNPTFLPSLLPPNVLRPAFQRHLETLEDTVSALILFGKTTPSLPALSGKNIFFCQNQPLAHAFLPCKKPNMGSFYITGTQSVSGHGNSLASPYSGLAGTGCRKLCGWSDPLDT